MFVEFRMSLPVAVLYIYIYDDDIYIYISYQKTCLIR